MKSVHFNTVINTAEFKTLENKAVERFIQSEIDTFEKAPSTYAVECFKLNFIIKLATVFDSYIKDTDTLKNFEISISNDLRLAIRMSVIRDEKQYWLETETIMAGGYIQCLHLRYIVKSNLNKLADKSLVVEYKSEIKRLTTIERLQKDVELFDEKVTESEKSYNEESKLTDDQIIENIRKEFLSVDIYSSIMNTTFETYIARMSERENRDGVKETAEEYKAYQNEVWNEYKERHFNYFKSGLKRYKSLITEYTKKKEKTLAKIQTLTGA